MKVSKRGGPREKIKIKSSTSRFLEVIWVKLGGPVAVGKSVDMGPSVIINWRIRGKIPFKLVPTVAAKLGILEMGLYGLNYEDCVKFFGFKSWESVVKDYKSILTNEQIDWILKGKKPKEILL